MGEDSIHESIYILPQILYIFLSELHNILGMGDYRNKCRMHMCFYLHLCVYLHVCIQMEFQNTFWAPEGVGVQVKISNLFLSYLTGGLNWV